MTAIIAVLITVAIFGVIVAGSMGHSGYFGYSPHLGGCLLVLVAGGVLAAIGMMKLGAYLW